MRALIEDTQSSMISAVAYDKDDKRLFVRFKNGSWYAYENVAGTTYTLLLGAESLGKAFDLFIKQAGIPYAKVDVTEGVECDENHIVDYNLLD